MFSNSSKNNKINKYLCSVEHFYSTNSLLLNKHGLNSFNRFKPGFINWAGQNRFNPGKMPTLAQYELLTLCGISYMHMVYVTSRVCT